MSPKIQLASHPHQLAATQPHSANSAFLPTMNHMQAAAFPVPVTGSGLEHMAVNRNGLEHMALASLGQDTGVHGLVTKKRVRDSSEDLLLVQSHVLDNIAILPMVLQSKFEASFRLSFFSLT